MSIESPVGTLDIKNATLRVGRLEVSNIQGIDTALNVTRANSVLIYDDQASTTTFTGTTSSAGVRDTVNGYLDVADGYVYWGQKLPNSWVMDFEMDIRSGTNAGSLNLNVFSSINTGSDGYSIVFDDNGDNIILKYDGATIATAAVSGLFTASENWQKVVINYERGMIAISLGGERKLYFQDIERETPYTTGEYINFSSASVDGRKIRDLKITNGSKWIYAGESNVVYTQGSVGVGVTDPTTALDVSGTVKATALEGDGSAITNISSANVGDFASNVTRIETLETDLSSNATRVSTLETDFPSNVTRIGTLETGNMTISGQKTFSGDVIFESNVHMQGDVFVANTVNMTVSDPIIELGSNNLNTGDLGIIMTRHGATNSNIAIVFDESADVLRMGYTLGGASDADITLDSNVLAVSVQGALTAASVSGDGSAITNISSANVGDFASNVTRIGTLETDLTSNVGRIGTLETDLTSNVGRIGTLETDLTSNVTRIGTLETDLTSNVGRIGTLETDLTSNVTRITNLESSDMTIGGEKTFSSNLQVGTADLFVDTTTGNVGIGTASPARPLEVAGSGGGAIINLKRTDYGTGQGALAFVNANSNVCASITATRAGTEGGNLIFYTVENDPAVTSDNPYLISARMHITSGGNVGIGTASPVDLFHVANGTIRCSDAGNTINIPGLKVRRRAAAVGQTGSNYIECGQFNDVGNDGSGTDGNKFIVTNTGNVGIGTTSPIAALDINGGAENNTTPALSIRGGSYDPSDLYVLNTYNTNTGVGYAAKVIGVNIKNKVETDNTVQIRNNVGGVTSAGAIYLGADDVNQGIFGVLGGTGVAGSTLGEYLTVKANGNVGIGTVSPRQKLEVANGHIAIVRNSWKSEAADDQLAGKIDFHLGGDAGQLATPVAAIEAYDKFQTGSSYGGVLAFKTLGTERMRILENGNVGIGTTSPAYTLDVNGLASSKTRRVFEFSGGDNYARHFWICSFLDAAGYHTNQLIKINYSVTYKRLTGTHSRNSLASGTVTLSNLWRYSTNATAGEYQYVTLQDQKNEQYTGQGRLPKWYYVRFNNRGYLVLCTSISSGDSSSYYVKGNVEFLTRPTAESADYVWNGTIYNDSSIAQTEGFTSISNLYPTTGTSEDGWDTTMTSGSTAQNFIEATEGTAFKYGNVGIGTTAPQTKFDVRSKALIGEYNSGGFYNANGRLHVRGNTNTPIILEKIGIITSGIGNFSGGMGLSTQGGAVDFRVAGAFNGDLGVSGSHVARFSNGGDRLQIYRDVNGSSPYFYYNSGGNYGTYSDRRGKKNIQTLNVSESVQYVKNLNPVSFNYYTETSDVTPQAGFIAQEVLEAETNPSQTKCVINGHETYDPDDVNSPNLGVGMQSMIPMLVQALQNALERIEALENNA
jgi:hypothetical protein